MVIAQSDGKGDTLCNVYLHRLDRQWQARGYGILVRYADLCGDPHRSAYLIRTGEPITAFPALLPVW
jgi:hypothetical protein